MIKSGEMIAVILLSMVMEFLLKVEGDISLFAISIN